MTGVYYLDSSVLDDYNNYRWFEFSLLLHTTKTVLPSNLKIVYDNSINKKEVQHL